MSRECSKMREYIRDHVHAFIDSDEIDRLMSYEEWCQLDAPNTEARHGTKDAVLGTALNRRDGMSDDQLIAEVARVWVDGGGDAEGLDWCHQKLKEAVNAEIENRVMQEQECIEQPNSDYHMTSGGARSPQNEKGT